MPRKRLTPEQRKAIAASGETAAVLAQRYNLTRDYMYQLRKKLRDGWYEYVDNGGAYSGEDGSDGRGYRCITPRQWLEEMRSEG